MLSDVQEPGDWILEAQWLNGEENTVAMVMAHNRVTLWNWQKGHTEAVVQSEVNCILYPSLPPPHPPQTHLNIEKV